MTNHYRSIIFAFGLVLACADHAYAKSDPKQANPQHSIAESHGNIATTYDQDAVREQGPDKQAEPCKRGDDRRYSDLCAQWKAADAASESAWWAWAGSFIGLASLVGVLAAIRLTYQANQIASNTAQQQLRAYLSVQSAKIILAPNHDNFWVAQMVLKNSGATPAHDVQFIVVVERGLAEEVDTLKPQPDWQKASKAAVGPNNEICCSVDIQGIQPAEVKGIKDGSYSIMIFGEARYVDAFGRCWETATRHEVYIRGERNSVELVACIEGNRMIESERLRQSQPNTSVVSSFL